MMDINKFGALVEDVRGRIERNFDICTNKSFSMIFGDRKYNQMELKNQYWIGGSLI